MDVLGSLDGGRFFGSDRYSKYGPNSACWACMSFSGYIDMTTSVALVKSSRSLSAGWISSRLCEFTRYGLNLGGPCVCVCVFFPFILDIKFVGRTSRGHTGGRSHRIFHPPSFCGACLNFSREKDSAIPFPRRP